MFTRICLELVREYTNKSQIFYCPNCGKPDKPKVVFYGENLPNSFFRDFEDIY